MACKERGSWNVIEIQGFWTSLRFHRVMSLLKCFHDFSLLCMSHMACRNWLHLLAWSSLTLLYSLGVPVCSVFSHTSPPVNAFWNTCLPFLSVCSLKSTLPQTSDSTLPQTSLAHISCVQLLMLHWLMAPLNCILFSALWDWDTEGRFSWPLS